MLAESKKSMDAMKNDRLRIPRGEIGALRFS